jgi:hypothetical protein
MPRVPEKRAFTVTSLIPDAPPWRKLLKTRLYGQFIEGPSPEAGFGHSSKTLIHQNSSMAHWSLIDS